MLRGSPQSLKKVLQSMDPRVLVFLMIILTTSMNVKGIIEKSLHFGLNNPNLPVNTQK